jgi:alpha-beta hydrolase superfamily lysophospholipase
LSLPQIGLACGRVIAHDRRGQGRSTQVSDGHDMDRYAADTPAVVEHLDLKNAVRVVIRPAAGRSTAHFKPAVQTSASPHPVA